MRKRKLLTRSALANLDQHTKLGVPLATAMRKFNIDMSRPAVDKLLKYYQMGDFTDSLFPSWVDPFGSAVQEQPDNWSYEGKIFPHGWWTECKDS